MSLENQNFDVFISYSHKDKDWVRNWLLPKLESAGVSYCIDDDQFDIGVPALINMERAVERSRKTLLVLSENWMASECTNFESLLVQTEDPIGLRQTFLPLKLDDCKLSRRLGIFTYADFQTPEGQKKNILRVVAQILEGKPQPTHRPRLPNRLVHPYPLPKHFTGRVAERRVLTEWLTAGEDPICALIAIGGMGKSALTWAWMKRDVLGERLPEAAPESAEEAKKCRVPESARPEGVFWWSFYEERSSFSAFLRDALDYVSNAEVDPDELKSDYDRAVALLEWLQQRRVLLVLDGFERELRGYAGLSAAYQGDDIEPGERPRECCDPHAAGLLKAATALLTGDSAGRLLLTSRLFPRELDGLAGCLTRDLLEFSPGDAEHFFRARGIRGTRAEFVAAWERYGRHPLTVSLLGGQIAEDPDKPGDVAVAQDYDPVPANSRKEGHVLELAFEALPEKARELLSSTAAFRSPVPFKLLKAAQPEASDREAKAVVKTLRERGMLLQQNSKEGAHYDLHPVVRYYAYDRLRDKMGVHSRFREYFSDVPDVDVQKLKSVDDLRPVIELYHHTVRAGLYEEALKLYRGRLASQLYYQLGAYQVDADLKRALFPDGEDRPPRLKSKLDQSWGLNGLAVSYHMLGRPRQAVELLERAARIYEEGGDKGNLAAGLSNLGQEQVNLGELSAAERNFRRSFELGQELEDARRAAISHQELGRTLALQARFAEADDELKQALEIDEGRGDSQASGLSWAYRAQRRLLADEPQEALKAAREALAFWEKSARERYPVERDRVRVEWLFGWTHIALAAQNAERSEKMGTGPSAAQHKAHTSGDSDAARSGPPPASPPSPDLESHLVQAEAHLSEALNRCHRIQLVEDEGDILLALARWHRLKGNPPRSRKARPRSPRHRRPLRVPPAAGRHPQLHGPPRSRPQQPCHRPPPRRDRPRTRPLRRARAQPQALLQTRPQRSRPPPQALRQNDAPTA